MRRWVTDYPEQLRPEKPMGRFRANNTAWWKDGDPGAAQAYWGGEVAANMLTKHLKPQNITVYMTNFKAGFRFLIVNRLQRDPEGDIEIIETFWNFEHEWQYDCMVHPILIYADLLATGDARNIETAEIISWGDESPGRNRDAKDLRFIMRNYLNAGNDERIFGKKIDIIDKLRPHS